MTGDLLDEITEPPPRLRERDMLALLRARYTKVRVGTTADRYVRAAHARCPYRVDRVAYGVAGSVADYIVLDTYGTSQTLGFEVKVSRADWLAELRNPRKAEAWRRYCDRWYLVVPDAGIVRDDLPPTWGLMVIGSRGALRIVRQAPLNTDRDAMPPMVVASLARAVAKTATTEALTHLTEGTTA